MFELKINNEIARKILQKYEEKILFGEKYSLLIRRIPVLFFNLFTKLQFFILI